MTMSFRQTKENRQRRAKRRKEQQRRRRKKRPENRQHLNRQSPQLTDALQGIAKTPRRPLSMPVPSESAQEQNEGGVLSLIYNGRYLPESAVCRKNDPFNREVQKTMDALCATFSPEQESLFLQYEAAANARGAAISERAYGDGFRLAVQLILTGRLGSAESL